jgi:hypothetical protein
MRTLPNYSLLLGLSPRQSLPLVGSDRGRGGGDFQSAPQHVAGWHGGKAPRSLSASELPPLWRKLGPVMEKGEGGA